MYRVTRCDDGARGCEDQVCSPYDQAVDNAATPTGFLDLPAELRLSIYGLALSELTASPEHPWRPYPSWSRFTTLRSLALTAAQVSEEVLSMFCKELCHHTHFYFNDLCNLHEFWHWAAGDNCLKHARFCLKVAGNLEPVAGFWEYYSYDGSYYPQVAMLDLASVDTLIRSDPALNGLWSTYGKACRPAEFLTGGYRDLLSRLPTGLRAGFAVRDGGPTHSYDSGHFDNTLYSTLLFPRSEHSLNLNIHQCWGRGYGYTRHSMELSGRLSDLTFEGVDIGKLRAEMYHARDSPWCTYRSPSPDLDEQEREDMDADSWGVPDIEDWESDTDTGDGTPPDDDNMYRSLSTKAYYS